MVQFVNPAQCCPEYDRRQYVFRGRKKIAAEADQSAGEGGGLLDTMPQNGLTNSLELGGVTPPTPGEIHADSPLLGSCSVCPGARRPVFDCRGCRRPPSCCPGQVESEGPHEGVRPSRPHKSEGGKGE